MEEEGSTRSQVAHPAVRNDPPPTGVSRRRMAFGPYSAVQPVPSTSSAQPVTNTNNTESDPNTANPAAASSLGKTTRKWGVWSILEINAFYDGIKQYGKDFDQVAKLMAKKKMSKDKDQIRNYYYNSFKLIRSSAQFDDDVIADFPRDARELFIVINGFEWKRRTEELKFDPVKLRQLILEGSTSVRLKKKKQNLVVRTPFCLSLQKFFPSRKTEEPLPSYVTIWLSPRTEADRSYVHSCGQNPLLKIRVSVSDQIGRIFSLLKAKWAPCLTKQDIFQQEDVASTSQHLNLVLYPDKCTRVESVYLRYVKDTAPSLFCLNRLKKERNWPYLEGEEQNSQMDTLGTGTSVDSGKVTEATTVENEHLSFPETNSFGLSALKLRAGLNEQIVGTATVTELFYLCGMEAEIRLQYSTNTERRNAVEPWNIFVSLINRNYGENLCKILTEPNDLENAQQYVVTVEGTRKRRASTSAAHSGIPTQSSAAVEKQPVSGDLSASAGNVAVINDHVVESENNAFKLQLESMQQGKKRGRPLVQRSAPPKSTVMSKLSSQPMQVGQFMTSVKPSTSAVSGTDCFFVSPDDVAQARQTVSGRFIDFSSIASPVNRNQSTFESSCFPASRANTTPTTHFAAEVLTTMSLVHHDTSANDASFLHSSSSAVAAEQVPPESSFASKMQNGSESTQKTLTELSAMEFCGAAPQNLDMTPTKNTSNLPEDVRHSFEMMMQQNSVDYCRNFEQLLTSIETPKKIP